MAGESVPYERTGVQDESLGASGSRVVELVEGLMRAQSSAIGQSGGAREQLLEGELLERLSGFSQSERLRLLDELERFLTLEFEQQDNDGGAHDLDETDIVECATALREHWETASEEDRAAARSRLAAAGITAGASSNRDEHGAHLSELRDWLGMRPGEELPPEKVHVLAVLVVCRLVGRMEGVAREVVRWVSGTEGPTLSETVARFARNPDDETAQANLAARCEGMAKTIATLLFGLKGPAASMALVHEEVFSPEAIRASAGVRRRGAREDQRCWAKFCELSEYYDHDKLEALLNRRLASDLAAMLNTRGS